MVFLDVALEKGNLYRQVPCLFQAGTKAEAFKDTYESTFDRAWAMQSQPMGNDVAKKNNWVMFLLFFPRASERRVFHKEGGVNRSTYKRSSYM